MELLGTAQLIEVPHSTGQKVKAWDLRPFGGDPLQLGLTTSPLPPEGTTVDRTLKNGRILRVETSRGEVYEVRASDPPPTVGPTGGPAARMGGGLLRSPIALAALAGAAWWWFTKGRRR